MYIPESQGLYIGLYWYWPNPKSILITKTEEKTINNHQLCAVYQQNCLKYHLAFFNQYKTKNYVFLICINIPSISDNMLPLLLFCGLGSFYLYLFFRFYDVSSLYLPWLCAIVVWISLISYILSFIIMWSPIYIPYIIVVPSSIALVFIKSTPVMLFS